MTDISSNSRSTVTAAGGAAGLASAPTKLHYLDAYEKTLADANALSPDDLIPVNIDVPSAVTTAVGVLPGILALRPRVAAELPSFDLKHFDLLETYTLATGQAHATFLGASAPPEALIALNEQGIALRDTLYSDALALANRGLISGDKLGDFKANVGYKNLAFDLLGLASILRRNWDKISSKTALEMSEIEQASFIAEQLVSAVAGREQAPALTAEQAQVRQRNFTLFVRAYDQVRRAISYLRWDEDDVDRIAPSLYAGRNTGRRKNVEGQGTNVPAPTTTSTNAGAPTPAATGGAPGHNAGPTTAPATTAPLPPGFPGGLPFTS